MEVGTTHPPNAFVRFSYAKQYCRFQKVGFAVVVTVAGPANISQVNMVSIEQYVH